MLTKETSLKKFVQYDFSYKSFKGDKSKNVLFRDIQICGWVLKLQRKSMVIINSTKGIQMANKRMKGI